MTTNRDWLFSLPLEEQLAWMSAEHQEPNPDCSATLYKTFTGNMEHEVEQDSRERLEADIRDTVTERHVDTIIGWLDRQAAITLAKDEAYCQECNGDYYKLQDERDELKGQVFTLKGECEDLENERDKLQEQLRIGWECECRLQAERELYRSKFGKCIDYADAIHALMDDEGLA